MQNVCLEDILGLVHTERLCSEIFRQADLGPRLPGFKSQTHDSVARGWLYNFGGVRVSHRVSGFSSIKYRHFKEYCEDEINESV